MTRNVYFILGIHNHQPVGNFPEVFEKAYHDAYRPFMEVMQRHPAVKWSLHATGILWEYLAEHHSEYLDAVRAMVKTGQVELMTGGYYEPILPAIPDRDKKGQIRKLTDFLQTTFGCTAEGMWLAERVWEPSLAKVIAESGVSYTVVDDAHFAAAGRDVEQLRGYYVTEEQGVPLSIFPISQQLRYAIPFHTVEKAIEYMASAARDTGFPALVMADDGEKFGLWPETYKHVYEDGWLDRFLSAVEQNREWLTPVTFSEYRRIAPPEGRIYLPTASYFEMSEWSLPVAAQESFEGIVRQFEGRPDVKRFLRGGFWRNFLTKYAEANTMHKKMLAVSTAVEDLAHRKRGKKAVPAAALAGARDALYAAECNCASWHGVFGGLYLPHLRTAVYGKLLEAERICVDATARPPRWHAYDFDYDGQPETVFEGREQNLSVAPHRGGSLFEWDVLPQGVNLLNVLTRRKESYHQRLRDFIANPGAAATGVKTIHDLIKVKEQNLDQYLHYDWYRRASLIDHFLHPATQYDDFRRVQYGEQGDFVLGVYQAAVKGKTLTLKREGVVWDNQVPWNVTVCKEIVPAATGMEVRYTITNRQKHDIDLVFAPEFAFAFSFMLDGENGVFENRRQWTRNDEVFRMKVDMSLSAPATLWVFPLETVSLSEAGFERTYQGTVVVPVHPLRIPAQRARTFTIILTAGALS
jgi:alpha-amylase